MNFKLTKLILSLSILFFTSLAYAQVGIGNTDPKATLDVSAVSLTAPDETNGVLVPRIEEFSVTNPGADQHGMLVFATGGGTVARGFYWWNNNSAPAAWTPFVQKIDDLLDGKSDNDGSNNGSSVFLGELSGANDDSDNRKNVAVGYQTLQANITGENNSAFGYRALNANTGVRNTAIGYQSLELNTSGRNNTAIGGQSLSSNLTGVSNVAVGAFTLSNNSVGSNNVAMGNQALRFNLFGTNNTAIGDFAGRVLDFNNSVNLDNDKNTYIGGKAGDSDFNASNNVYIGFQAGGGDYIPAGGMTPASGTLESKSGNVFIGFQAGLNESNSDKLYIENSDNDADNALIYGEFDTNTLRVNGTLQVSNPTGTGYALPTTDGSANQVLTTNGSGAVTWQNASTSGLAATRVIFSSNQTLTTTGWVKANFNTTEFDINGDFNTTTDVFDVPANGIYRINAIISSNATLNNVYKYGIRIIKNSGTVLQEVYFRHMNENSEVVRQVNTLLELTSTDTISIEVRCNNTSTPNITINSNSNLSSLTIERVR